MNTDLDSMNRRRLRRLRTALEATQGQLGRMLNAHWVTISKWERGVGRPDEWQTAALRLASRNLVTYPDRMQVAKELVRSGQPHAALAVLLAPSNWGPR
jgi:DNA-binding XRE family transcriptional regulator